MIRKHLTLIIILFVSIVGTFIYSSLTQDYQISKDYFPYATLFNTRGKFLISYPSNFTYLITGSEFYDINEDGTNDNEVFRVKICERATDLGLSTYFSYDCDNDWFVADIWVGIPYISIDSVKCTNGLRKYMKNRNSNILCISDKNLATKYITDPNGAPQIQITVDIGDKSTYTTDDAIKIINSFKFTDVAE